jgi:hypothetical protein
MIERHLTVPHRFICFTDDARQLNPNIEIRNLPLGSKYHGWWWKPYVFKEGHFPDGDVNLFIDLDMVIISNIDKFINYESGKFLGLEDVGRVFGRGVEKLGSAVMRWPANTYTNIWTAIENDPSLMNKFHGDQDLIWHLHKTSIKFYPAEWIRSYKWEIRTRSELVRSTVGWNFNSIKTPNVHPDTAILAFHGTPNPHEVLDPIIVDNWR